MIALRRLTNPHNLPGTSRTLREALGARRGLVRLSAAPFRFSILTHNMAALAAPGDYLGPDGFKSHAFNTLVTQVRRRLPDVVGLCELFEDNDREWLRGALADVYPHWREGPDEGDLESDGGLLLLSRHPIVRSHSTIFRHSAAADSFANKGVLYARIAPPGLDAPVDLFYSHMQAIYEDGDGTPELKEQLWYVRQMVRSYWSRTGPAFLFGDLNFAGETLLYRTAMERLGNPVDLWLTQDPLPKDGTTYSTENTFYADPDDAPTKGERLDYLLLYPGRDLRPQPSVVERLIWQAKGRHISDHFGVGATFEAALSVSLAPGGTIEHVTVRASSIRCLEATGFTLDPESGDDEVTFSFVVTAARGGVSVGHTPTLEEVSTGQLRAITGGVAATLAGDPGDYIDISLTGTEVDGGLTANDDLGRARLRIDRTALLLALGGSMTRALPFLTKDGGEYAVEVTVTVR